MKKITIHVYRQFIKLIHPNLGFLVRFMFDFNKKLVTFKYSKTWDKRLRRLRTEIKVDKKFYIVDNNQSCIRYPFSLKEDIIEYLNKNNIEIEIKEFKPSKSDKVDYKLAVDYKPREDQQLYINLITNINYPTTLIDLKTGGGKTFISMYAMSKLKRRFGVIVLPRYIDKWKQDLEFYLGLGDEDVYVIQGGNSLRKLMSMSKEDRKKIKAYIISLKTLTIYINEYLDIDQPFTYPVEPDDLNKILRVGYLLSDEVHQEFHNVYLSQMFIPTKKLIGMSATLESNDKRTNNMYKLLFPIEARLQEEVEHEPYINVIAIKYNLDPIYRKTIKYKSTQGYSQIKFEQSILKRRTATKRYIKMINTFLEALYIKRREEGDKCIIFAGTIAMCKQIRDYLKRYHPNLIINKYTQEDDFDVFDKSDVIVSTLLSSGTAIDIPNLITVLQTIAIDSIQANKQGIGRLRKIKGKEVIYAYFYCSDIESHRRYNINKTKYFKHISKSNISLTYREYV